jgi:hypothetical protein
MSQKTIGMMLLKEKIYSQSLGLLHQLDGQILNQTSVGMKQICPKCIINGKF